MKHINQPISDTKQLDEVRDRFELWRRDHPGRHGLPQELWSAAAKLAGQYGVYRTAKTLRVGYDSLKQHVQGGAVVGEKRSRTPRFVELLPLSPATMPECSIELENVRGAKIKIQLNGAAVSELSHLTRLFWSEL